MQHDVFISYTTDDKPTADAICHALEAQGVRCWIAPRDIPLGHNYAETLIEAINAAKAMVLVFSANTNQSRHVGNEVERAFNRDIPVIPFRIENTPATGALEYFLSMPHWLDAFTPPMQQHLASLGESVRALLAAGSGQPKVDAPIPRSMPVAAQVSPAPAPIPEAGSKKSRLPLILGIAAVVIAVLGLGAVYLGHPPAPDKQIAEIPAAPPAQPSPPAPAPQPAAEPAAAPQVPAAAPPPAAEQPSTPPQAAEKQSVSSDFGWVGIIVQAASPEDEAKEGRAVQAVVRDVGRDSPAAKAGIKPGDLIVSFDNKPVVKLIELVQMIGDQRAGQAVDIVAQRRGETLHFHVVSANIRQLAEGGNPDAMFMLGNLSLHRDKNQAEAIHWYRKAADLGQTTAMVVLGMAYGEGQGVPQNYDEAMRLYRKAADLGDAQGMLHIALLYLNGRGVQMNRLEAEHWYKMAAERGNPAAQAWLREHGGERNDRRFGR